MGNTFGQALRMLREAQHPRMSTRDLAKVANCSPSAVGQVAALAGLGATAGPGAVAEAVRAELISALDNGQEADWSAVVGRYATAMVTEPAPVLERQILGDLALTRPGLRAGDRDTIRAAATLSLLQGQCRSDRGDVATARGWYATAGELADRSGDTRLAAFVRARHASRLIYEDGDVRRVSDVAEAGMSRSRTPSFGTVECYTAKAAVQARHGDPAARECLRMSLQMAPSVAPDPETGFDPVQRVLYGSTYVLSRVGTLAEAESATEQALQAGLPPLWRAQARLNLAYALAAAGDVTEGIRMAAEVVGSVQRHHRTRIFGQLVTDLLTAVPTAARGDADARRLNSMAKGR